jgi:hypothetical protein
VLGFVPLKPSLELTFCNDAECAMSIADTYRSMSEDVRRLARETKDEAARDAYLALAELWHERSVRLESGVVPTKPAITARA